jgi:hypothetical protein
MDSLDIPDIDLEEMKKFKEENFRERLAFIDWHVQWMKKNSNKIWSKAQKELIDAQVKQ